MVEAHVILIAATSRRRFHPVIPFSGKPFRQEHAATRGELAQRHSLLPPCAVDLERGGPARPIIFHERDVQSLLGREAPQPYSQLPPAGDRRLTRRDA